MKETRPQPPSARDQTIYQFVIDKATSQAEVAQMWGISQARVSQIVKQVREWLSLVSGDETNVEQDLFIAARETRVGLEEELVRASREFDLSCGETMQSRTISLSHRPESMLRVEKTVRSGRANSTLLREIVRLREQIFQAKERECIYKAQMLRKQSHSRWWRDEEKVQRCLDLCRQMVLQMNQRSMIRPFFDLEIMTKEIRARVAACAVDAPEQDLVSYLPEEWQMFAKQLNVVDLAEGERLVKVEEVVDEEVYEEMFVAEPQQPEHECAPAMVTEEPVAPSPAVSCADTADTATICNVYANEMRNSPDTTEYAYSTYETNIQSPIEGRCAIHPDSAPQAERLNGEDWSGNEERDIQWSDHSRRREKSAHGLLAQVGEASEGGLLDG